MGHVVSTTGIMGDLAKVDAFMRRERPTTTTEIGSFLGFVTYCRRFIQGFSSLAAPHTQLTRKEEHFIWTNACEQSFQTLKERLTTTSVLSLPDGHDNFVVYNDASDIGLDVY